jgi:nitrogen fixation protein NifU and related proteins
MTNKVIKMEYTDKVISTFKNPRNMGEIADADAVGKVGNPTCGDLMWMFLKIEKNKKGEDYIKDVKVKTFGCVAAIATSSIMTDLIKGKTIKEAKKIKKDDIVKELGGLPKEKVHCSLLATEAFTDAMKNWDEKRSIKKPADNITGKPKKQGVKI